MHNEQFNDMFRSGGGVVQGKWKGKRVWWSRISGINPHIPIPVPAPASACLLGSSTALSPLKEITKEATFICEDLDGLLREADEERVRELQGGSSSSVVCLPPQVDSEEWRRLNGIH